MTGRSSGRTPVRGPARVPPGAVSAAVEREATVETTAERARRAVFRKRRNRRVAVQTRAPVVLIADGVTAFGRKLLAVLRVAGKAVIVLGLVAGVLWGGRLAVGHVLASPRFALRDIQVSATLHVSRDEILALGAVEEGHSLLALDTDAVAARIARHPWVASARVERLLPSTLRVDVFERQALATVTLGGLYLVDDSGRPFKRATMEEAEGLPVITGIDRDQYVNLKAASEAALRDVLRLLDTYRAKPGRPPLSEVAVHPRFGYTLFLLDGGAEVRLGRGSGEQFSKKLAQLDQIFEAVRASSTEGIGAIRVVHLDGSNGTRVPVKLAERAGEETTPPGQQN